MAAFALEVWHSCVRNRSIAALDAVLAEDSVFYSPVVFTPQRGKELVKLYLAGALQVLGNESFRYVKEIVQDETAMLEFEASVDGIYVNGVDILTWNEQGQIQEVKVMLRPLKAIHVLQQRMREMLELLREGS
ncbi:hypothetical protein HRbin30_00700 [bacterium HR30]|nr:hypothetical protein HRbin30_00700 [bacterium HR30]